MTEEQLDALRYLIKQEIDAAQIDGMEHGVWGWGADKQLEEGRQEFKNRFINKFSMVSNIEGAPIIKNGEYIGVINSIEKNLKDESDPIAYVHIFDQLY